MLKLLIAVSSFGESLRWEFLTGSAETVFFSIHCLAIPIAAFDVSEG
jgi:hypothetical protein